MRQVSLGPPARRHRAAGRLALAVLLVFGATSCSKHEVALCRKAPGGPLVVQLGGCVSWSPRSACELPKSRALNLWADAPDSIVVSVDGRVIDARTTPVQGGQRCSVTLPPAASMLCVQRRGSSASRVWCLGVSEPLDVPELEEAERLRRSSQAGAARLKLAPLLEREPRVAGRAMSILARIDLQEGEEGAAEAMAKAIELHRQADNQVARNWDASTLGYLLINSRRALSKAAQVLAAAAAEEKDEKGNALLALYQGMLAFEEGDARRASSTLKRSHEAAERMGDASIARSARTMEARTLDLVGRGAESRKIYRELLDDPSAASDPCDRALLLLNVGWSALLDVDRGERLEGDQSPAPYLLEARAIYRSSCDAAQDVALTDAHLALDAAQRGDPRLARGYLEAATRGIPPHDVTNRTMLLDVEGRAYMLEKRPAVALSRYLALAKIASAHVLPGVEYQSVIGAARALEAIGRHDESLRNLERAEALVDSGALNVPLGGGRDQFTSTHEQAARFHISSLLAAGDRSQAVLVARRSRARSLRPLGPLAQLADLAPASREAWRRSVELYQSERANLDEELSQLW
jgi:tetratricopeptide (TPR) repeat protein